MPITVRIKSGPSAAVTHKAVVIGGVNVDIGGQPFLPLVVKDSNPGRVTVSFGGVGRNIAHNMSLLGISTEMLTALGDDFYASGIVASCQEAGIGISHALRIPGESTSTYLYLNNCDGDMELAVSDMEICRQITPAYLEPLLWLLENAQVVVFDTNIPEESVVWLAEHCTRPLFADCVSTKKAEKLRPVLGKLHTLKPNRIEAELLSGVHICDDVSLRVAAETLLATGLRRVFISLGAEGVLAAEDGKMLRMHCYPAEVKNITGAGDAFMAALVRAYAERLSLEDTVCYASAAASIATESVTTINPALSAEAVRSRIQNNPLPAAENVIDNGSSGQGSGIVKTAPRGLAARNEWIITEKQRKE